MTPQADNRSKTPLMKKLRPRLGSSPYVGANGLLLAVSGGMDSMALLDAMIAMAHVHGAPLRALHVHHGTGPFADRSQALVERFCQANGVPLTVRRFEWNGAGNFEFEAAAFRRKALAQSRRDGEWILLAHHLQDQAETFFQSLTRGAGPTTPAGMSLQRGFFLRPLLDIDRALIADHARRRGTPHGLDPSNYDQAHFRNAVRHRVMPTLRSFHEGFEARLHHWLTDYQAQSRALADDAGAIFQRRCRDGVLSRAAFAEAKPYLWDFLLRFFWEAHELPNPKHGEHRLLKQWLAEGETGSFDHQGRRVYCDLDGLAVFPQPTERARQCRFSEEAPWGAWRFLLRLENLAEARQTGGYTLTPMRGAAKTVREHLRLVRAPLRIRANLPAFHFGGQSFHYYDLARLEKAGFLRISHTAGPELKPYFENLKPAEAPLVASAQTGIRRGFELE